jgi:hypothetical protein
LPKAYHQSMATEDERGNIMRSNGLFPFQIIQRILPYSVCRSKQMEPMLSNWPCTAFPVRCKELMHAL